MRWKMNKSMKRRWLKVPVKVEQIIEYLFSDTVQSQKKKWQWWNKPRSRNIISWITKSELWPQDKMRSSISARISEVQFLIFISKHLRNTMQSAVTINNASWRGFITSNTSNLRPEVPIAITNYRYHKTIYTAYPVWHVEWRNDKALAFGAKRQQLHQSSADHNRHHARNITLPRLYTTLMPCLANAQIQSLQVFCMRSRDCSIGCGHVGGSAHGLEDQPSMGQSMVAWLHGNHGSACNGSGRTSSGVTHTAQFIVVRRQYSRSSIPASHTS